MKAILAVLTIASAGAFYAWSVHASRHVHRFRVS
jgi:hypothetical protein